MAECLAYDEPNAAWACDCPACTELKAEKQAWLDGRHRVTGHAYGCECRGCLDQADYERETKGWYE